MVGDYKAVVFSLNFVLVVSLESTERRKAAKVWILDRKARKHRKCVTAEYF